MSIEPQSYYLTVITDKYETASIASKLKKDPLVIDAIKNGFNILIKVDIRTSEDQIREKLETEYDVEVINKPVDKQIKARIKASRFMKFYWIKRLENNKLVDSVDHAYDCPNFFHCLMLNNCNSKE